MPRRFRPDTLLQRPLRVLQREIGSAVSGASDSLHRARVATRRLREAMPIFEPALPEAALKKSRRRIRRVTRALGPVRELDVVLRLLDDLKVTEPETREAIERVRQHVAEERDERRGTMQEQLHHAKLEKAARKLNHVAPSLDTADPRRWRKRLAERVERRGRRLRAAILRAGPMYLPDRLHTVRVATKKLRYVMELAGESGCAPARPAVRVLRRSQDVLGRLHDLEIAIAQVHASRAALGASEPSMAPQLDALVRTIERECRELHGRYMARRQELLDVAASASRDIAPAIAGRPTRRPVKMGLRTAARKAS